MRSVSETRLKILLVSRCMELLADFPDLEMLSTMFDSIIKSFCFGRKCETMIPSQDSRTNH